MQVDLEAVCEVHGTSETRDLKKYGKNRSGHTPGHLIQMWYGRE